MPLSLLLLTVFPFGTINANMMLPYCFVVRKMRRGAECLPPSLPPSSLPPSLLPTQSGGKRLSTKHKKLTFLYTVHWRWQVLHVCVSVCALASRSGCGLRKENS